MSGYMRKAQDTRRRSVGRSFGKRETALADVPNLGPKSAQMLARAGITTLKQLRELGTIAAYVSAKRAGGNVSLNLLWALEAALTGMRWQDVARAHRTSLLLALDQFKNGS